MADTEYHGRIVGEYVGTETKQWHTEEPQIVEEDPIDFEFIDRKLILMCLYIGERMLRKYKTLGMDPDTKEDVLARLKDLIKEYRDE